MKLIEMKCTSCGGILDEVNAERSFVFCRYCGAKLFLDKGETTVNYNDGAKIKQAEVVESLGKMKMDTETQTKNQQYLMVILGIMWLAMFIIGLYIIKLVM